MNEPLNTLPGYEPQNATIIPDEEDNGVGLCAGDRVEHESWGEGTVQAIVRGQGLFHAGQVVVDVKFDDNDESIERLDPFGLEVL